MQKLYNNENLIFLAIFGLNLLFLLYSVSNLSISFYEAEIYYEKQNLVSLLANLSCKFFGQNDFALRAPFLLIHFFNSILIYKISKTMLKRKLDRLISVSLYMFLPGVMASAILVNLAGVIIFFTLLAVYFSETRNNIALIITLLVTTAIDKSFVVLYVGAFLYGIYRKNKILSTISFLCFVSALLFYDFDIQGKPKGFFIDTIGVYSAVFSPFLFLFFIYVMYRIWIKERKNLLWFVCISAFCIASLLSLRQRVELDEFLPYAVVSVPLLVRVFFNSYRIRLPRFRTKHTFLVIVVMLFLLINSSFVVFNQILYPLFFKNEPQKHFIYNYDIAKELAQKLKEKQIYSVKAVDSRLGLRLKFYGIKASPNLYMSRIRPQNAKFSIKIYKFDTLVDKFYVF
ncbi:ArnT family glycosyltransferase [Campylobacter geochelonis]|uniref:ArnT family glycosyltransferase n=1 Tax=Campylobacter geochelonis TaxID=1780362 RepID=UPI000770A11E|nr:glycosyltransferase family 39 protein [Campylobacter geochelonis]CZE50896.1 putative integral membrane protein [Campylobacter geochelonis]